MWEGVKKTEKYRYNENNFKKWEGIKKIKKCRNNKNILKIWKDTRQTEL